MQSKPDPSTPRPPSGASGAVVPGSKLDQAIQNAGAELEDAFRAELDDNRIRNRLDFAWIKVRNAIEKAGDSKLMKRLKDESEFISYVSPGSDNERELINSLRSMAAQEVPWRDLFKSEAFIKPEKQDKKNPSMDLATRLAWDGEYKGDLPRVLFDTIADYLSKDRNPKPYAMLTTVVNSSGTGKSRMVDQLGTEVVAVPMCLRREKNGFPPPDEDLRIWLTSETRDRVKMLHGFTYSLLMVTLKRLKTIEREILKPSLGKAAVEDLSQGKREEQVSKVADRQKDLASAFRQRMTSGQTYYTTNLYRKAFYTEVIKEAKEFVDRCVNAQDEKEPEHGKYTTAGEGLKDAGEDLCRFLDEDKVLNSENGPRRPLVILAFDEAHTLTDNLPNHEEWNLFTDLCRVLRQINHLQIFSLFLSTAGGFHKFSPDIHHEKSARARDPEYRPLNPILEISFDDVAYPALKDTVTINRVVDIDWISHLGRPLFGTYWDNVGWQLRNESTLMDFAKQKLLGGPDLLKDDSAASLACLSTRFALEFNMDETAHDVAYTHVEWHMRLCIAATAGFEKIITIPGSEPLLAEAAYQLMETNTVRHLAMHSNLNCIDRGRRGELVASLLMMQAYDAARKFSETRWVSVGNFMKALLPSQKYDTLLRSAPTSWPMDNGDSETFEATFKDYGMWFNHVIRIEESEMISIDHLWKFVVRGAMILCAANQEGIDIILPVCHTKKYLGPDSMTAIIIQVKNAKTYKAPLHGDLFDAMDSVVKSTIFSKLPEPGVDCDTNYESTTRTSAEPDSKRRKVLPPERVKVKPKAVIRIVMALASPEPAVVFKDRPQMDHHFDGNATFDIWLAGLSKETFGHIQDRHLEHYKTLLGRSLAPHNAFELGDVLQIGKKAKKSREARRRKMVPLAFPEHHHHIIHRAKPGGSRL